MEDRQIYFGGAVKALGDNKVGGYLIAFTDRDRRDLQGEYFTAETDLMLDSYPIKGERTLYHHGLDQTLGVKKIGTITDVKISDVGVWVEAQLEAADEYARAIYELVKRGKLGWSSGALPQSVRVDSDGHIKSWSVIEASLTPSPAMPIMTKIQPLKSYLESVMPLDAVKGLEDKEPQAETAPDQSPNSAKAEIEITTESENNTPEGGKLTMSQEMLDAFMAALEAAGVVLSEEQRAAVMAQFSDAMNSMSVGEMEQVKEFVASDGNGQAPAPVAKAMAQLKAIAQQVVAPKPAVKPGLVDAAKAAVVAPQSKIQGVYTEPKPAAGRIEMRTKYADLSAEDMSYYALIQRSRRAAGQPHDQLGQTFVRELADKAAKAYNAGQIRLDGTAVKAINAVKSDELDYSTQASYGDDFVPDLWAQTIWEKARLDNQIAPLFNMVDMPSNPFELPVESTDPTVYYVGETTSENQLTLADSNSPIPDSKVGTAKVQLAAKKLALRVGFSAELEEDSIIPFAAQLRTQAQRAIQDAIDNVLLNGDTETGASTNINLIDGTPAATAKYLVFNGLLKLPLVTTTANSVDMGGISPTLAKLRQARFTMAAGYAIDPRKIAYITDASTYAKLLGLGEVITIDKYGPSATVLNGEMGKIDGSPLIVSAEMALANSAGKIPNAGGTLGRIAVVYTPGWTVGYRRRVNVSMDFFSAYDAYQLTATVRLAFASRDSDVSAVLYNILV